MSTVPPALLPPLVVLLLPPQALIAAVATTTAQTPRAFVNTPSSSRYRPSRPTGFAENIAAPDDHGRMVDSGLSEVI
jgi:hypothetical protein